MLVRGGSQIPMDDTSFYPGSESNIEGQASLFFVIASAIANTKLSSDVPLKAFTAQRTKRLFAIVYPFSGCILSMLGVIGWRLSPSKLKGSPDIAQRPVHTLAAQAFVSSQGSFSFLALDFVAISANIQGVRFRATWE